ncbi:MAG: hypothetical protein LUG26_07040, partial [Ruminococcus sp.]|nr:hypothetical protein [Ruminococcus sp.]
GFNRYGFLGVQLHFTIGQKIGLKKLALYGIINQNTVKQRRKNGYSNFNFGNNTYSSCGYSYREA